MSKREKLEVIARRIIAATDGRYDPTWWIMRALEMYRLGAPEVGDQIIDTVEECARIAIAQASPRPGNWHIGALGDPAEMRECFSCGRWRADNDGPCEHCGADSIPF